MKKIAPKPHVYVIVGPTGVGKTSLSIALAKKVGGEIISADSRQVYTGLSIGTEKISRNDMRGVRHHLIDVCNPKKTFTVADFKKRAEATIADIQRRGKVPIVVGGTGWYVDAVLHGHTLPDVPPNAALRKKLDRMSAVSLFAMLKKMDPARATSIDPHNSRRLVRAIEIAKALGKVPKLKSKSLFDSTWLGIVPPPDYEQALRRRLLRQIRRGLIGEIRTLLATGITKKRIRELGLEYRTGLRYIDGELSRRDMIEIMTTELRQLAKRQMTWFKRNKEISWKSLEEHQKAIRQ